MSMVSSYQPNESLAPPPPADAVELSARHLERMLAVDSGAAGLGDRLGGGTVSGLQDRDYPATSGQDALPLRQTVKVTRVPLPPELVEHFGHMACNCSMGLFTQLDRAWLTIDSDIYVWRYEDGGDLAYFDGLSDTILNVALVTPKPGVLQPHIKHLLALSTPVEIVLLGLSLAGEELQLVPEPLFSLPADQLHTSCLVGSPDTGRVWLGGRDGHLYEFCYTAQDGWWAKKTSKVGGVLVSWWRSVPCCTDWCAGVSQCGKSVLAAARLGGQTGRGRPGGAGLAGPQPAGPLHPLRDRSHHSVGPRQ